ncbi:MAG TPA: hypothetical protein VLT33_45180 [Labilithrix sp.]|nr:hypothetical protein [Labilithrix sp.]
MVIRAPLGLAAIVLGIAVAGNGCTCSKASDPGAASDAAAAEAGGETPAASADAGGPGGLSAPIAAARIEAGDVVVAGIDVPAKAIRIQRINPRDEVTVDRTILEGVKWSSESDLRVVPAARGVAVTWRGLRNGKLVRQMLLLGPDLAPQGDVHEVAAASCATRDALWFTDGKRVHGLPWTGSALKSSLPRDRDAALVCGQHRAFALLDEEDGTSVLLLGGGDSDAGAPSAGDAGAAADAGKLAVAPGAVSLLKESEFGEDDQRERAEYTVGDDLGVVRLAASGAMALREIKGGVTGPLRRLKTTIGRDDDVVAVDASLRQVVVVYTEDVGEACPGASGVTVPSTRVKALRIDRTTFEESVVELSPGACGKEVGPFFTGALLEAVSVAWVERIPVKGQSKAPVAGLAHRLVVPTGALAELVRAEQPADALVDGGCDGTRCYAVALARQPGMDAMVPGLARVIRY